MDFRSLTTLSLCPRLMAATEGRGGGVWMDALVEEQGLRGALWRLNASALGCRKPLARRCEVWGVG